MEKKIVGFIPRILYKIFLALKEKFDPTLPVPEEEKITVEICKKLLDDPKSELHYYDLAKKRFIKNAEKDMFIVMQDHTINLINHVYSYSIYVSDTAMYRELTSKFDDILDAERIKMEDEINSNIKHSLSSILSKLN